MSQSGVYGTTTPGAVIYPYVSNYPGTRIAPGYWVNNNVDASNRFDFWIFGGEGLDQSSGNGNGLLSDLWRYLPYR